MKKQKTIMTGYVMKSGVSYWGYGYPNNPMLFRTLADVKAEAFGPCWKPIRVKLVTCK